jgi:hypothetical protein
MYGHRRGEEQTAGSTVELQDGAIEIDEECLVALQGFVQYALDDLRRLGAGYDHVHFQDKCKAWRETWPDIILMRTKPDVAGGTA